MSDLVATLMGKINFALSRCPGTVSALADRLPSLQWGWPRCLTMPAVRGRKGWCGCFEDDEPPVIFRVEDPGGKFTIHPNSFPPMPAEEEVDAKFAEVLEELDLKAANKTAMLSLPLEKKWQIYCSKILDQVGTKDHLPQLPQDYITHVQTLVKMIGVQDNVSEQEMATYTHTLNSLKTALRTQPNSFVQKFVECDGLPVLLDCLTAMDYRTLQTSLHTSLIGCVNALMNNSTGRSHVLAHPTAINTIAQSLATENVKTKIAVLEILGAVCLVPGGHKKVLDAMTHYQQFSFERSRFQGIINNLDNSLGVYRDDVCLKTAIMSFINAVLNRGPGQENLEFRLHLRYELLMLGIQHIITKLRRHENQTLDKHLDYFEMKRNEDEKELARKFEMEHVDTTSATAMFEVLRRKLSHTVAYPHLLSMLHHCILLPLDYGSLPQHWMLFDRVVQQLVLQTDSGSDLDTAPLKINVKEIVELLVKEEELVAAKKKADDLEKDNIEMATKLSKKEQELDIRTLEKEDIESSLMRAKERLEMETAANLEAKQTISSLQDKISDLEHRVGCEEGERHKLERILRSGSFPDDTKDIVNMKSVESKKPTAPIPPPPGPISPPPPAPGPPPIPSGINMPPPPPRPPVVKNVPQPSNPLKAFNWSKLPDTKLSGTVWTELDETKLYNSIELETIDKLFCSVGYKRNEVVNGGSVEDLVGQGNKGKKILSVIDGRRAQNCTILLSKLKMSDDEISKVIMSMDSRDQLPLDMVEQMLKFTPSSEEAAQLEEHNEEIDSLARADRFLYEISKIPHYEQRLRCLHYKKRFNIWVSEIVPRVRSVLEASREVSRSRQLRRLLELVLALGNYMNRGGRGNATGFRLASLNRLADTKSSASKGITLLHYLVQILEKKDFKDILRLEEELPHVKEAAKVCLGELEKDVAQLRNNLKEVERELEFHRVQPVADGDRFLPVMKEFLTTATCRFSELEDLFKNMKTKFDQAVRLFGEDNSTVQPDEFFGIFDTFLVAFQEARHDNVNIKRKREEEEKRAKQDAELKKKTIDRKNSRTMEVNGCVPTVRSGPRSGSVSGGGENGAKGDFDDLISALRTGDVFGEDMAKMKRIRKSRLNGNSPPRKDSLNREDSRERVLSSTRQQ